MRGVILAAALIGATLAASAEELKPPSAFDQIADKAQRSAALFEEAGKVLQHPRCLNCHPAGDRPTQGSDMHPHQPWVRRGDGGVGVAGLHCNACHQRENFDPARVPGNPKWQLAPIEMAWQGKSLGEICRQLKDKERNGGRSVDEIVEHNAHDELVAYGWKPGAGRDPVPGTQAQFGALFRAWADTGAACPG